MGTDDIKEKTASPLGKLLSRFGKNRSNRTDLKVNQSDACRIAEEKKKPLKSSRVATSSPSRFGTLVSRLSTRKGSKLSKGHETDGEKEDAGKCEKSFPVKFSSPRPAMSENDLRFVTVGRGSERPQTPLAGVTHFMSQENLTSPVVGSPLEKVPSYVKISCTLNGYGTPRRSTNVSQPESMMLGRSFVERRLHQFRNNPTVEDSPVATSRAIRKVPPVASQEDATFDMGANCSTTASPVKGLIEQFNSLHLFLNEKSLPDNIKPHKILIDTQPQEQVFQSKNEVCQISVLTTTGPPSSSATMNVIQAPADSTTKDTECVPAARTGYVFRNILKDTCIELEQLCEKALVDQETVENMPEPAADSIRMATGKAKLLIKKKIGKFESLVRINLGEEPSDKFSTNEDLEGYWSLVEMELKDIHSFFQTIENYRVNGWRTPVVDEETTDNGRSTHNEQTPKPAVRRSVAASNTKTEAQKKKEEERALKRKEMMEQAKARMKEAKALEDSKDNFLNGGVIC